MIPSRETGIQNENAEWHFHLKRREPRSPDSGLTGTVSQEYTTFPASVDLGTGAENSLIIGATCTPADR
jgi:hypothetical protein